MKEDWKIGSKSASCRLRGIGVPTSTVRYGYSAFLAPCYCGTQDFTKSWHEDGTHIDSPPPTLRCHARPSLHIFNAGICVISWSCRNAPPWLKVEGSNPTLIPPHHRLIANLVWWMGETRFERPFQPLASKSSHPKLPSLLPTQPHPSIFIPSLHHYHSLWANLVWQYALKPFRNR